MTKSKKNIVKGQAVNPNMWMVTFSDLVMLLLTFFVLLLSMSSMDAKKLKSIFLNFKDAAGILELSGARGITALSNFINKYKESESLIVIDQSLLEDLLPSIKPDKKILEMMQDINELMDITDDERGIVLSFQENILFDPGEATIKKQIFPALDSIATAIESCSNDILIMGHTDNTQIQSKLFKSNWELSSYRGLSILEYFLKEKGLQPARFSVGGYGPSRPLYPNDTPKNRALNRRVEIIFKHL